MHWIHRCKDLKPLDFKIFAYICAMSDDAGSLEIPFQTLAAASGVPQRALEGSLRRLEERGYIFYGVRHLDGSADLTVKIKMWEKDDPGRLPGSNQLQCE